MIEIDKPENGIYAEWFGPDRIEYCWDLDNLS